MTFAHHEVDRTVAVILRSALRLYRDTGIKANTMYTPKNMMRKATQITGRTFKPRAYSDAINALTKFIED